MTAKKLTFFIVFIIIVVVIGWFLKKLNTPTSPHTIPSTLTFNGTGLSFIYPRELTLSEKTDAVVLHHEIPYENTGACDMMGDEKTYDTLTDFHVTLRIASTSLVQTVRQMSSYIPEENFDGNVLKVNPGFIDSFEAGALKGFAIYEGAEGCGFTTYYFPISGNRTLIIQKESIQALSGVRGQEEVQRILKVPGSIAPSVSDKIFKDILTSLVLK